MSPLRENAAFAKAGARTFDSPACLPLEAVYIEAKNVCAAGETQIMKSDRNDADGCARIVRNGIGPITSSRSKATACVLAWARDETRQ